MFKQKKMEKTYENCVNYCGVGQCVRGHGGGGGGPDFPSYVQTSLEIIAQIR